MDSSPESSVEEDESERLGNTDWYDMNNIEDNEHFAFFNSFRRCSCGLCVAMPTVAESICCAEIEKIQEKKGEEVNCITMHPGFQSVCLDV